MLHRADSWSQGREVGVLVARYALIVNLYGGFGCGAWRWPPDANPNPNPNPAAMGWSVLGCCCSWRPPTCLKKALVDTRPPVAWKPRRCGVRTYFDSACVLFVPLLCAWSYPRPLYTTDCSRNDVYKSGLLVRFFHVLTALRHSSNTSVPGVLLGSHVGQW